jgi:hypothetical protein
MYVEAGEGHFHTHAYAHEHVHDASQYWAQTWQCYVFHVHYTY